MRQPGLIGVLMGGYSSEREISLKSGQAIAKALKEAGCQVNAIDIPFKDEEKILDVIHKAKIDVAFIALHGSLGEDGRIQDFLEKSHVPYVGSGVAASRLAINKARTQALFKTAGIPVAEHLILESFSIDRLSRVLKTFSFPVVVKPACEGSSIGVTIVFEKENLEVALKEAFRYGSDVLVEQYIKGREFTVGILNEAPLPVVEICPANPFFDFKAKYFSQGQTQYIVPAKIDDKLAKMMQSIALKAHQILNCRHFSRVDMMLDEDLNPYVLEVNTIPGFTETSLLPKAASAAGINFTQLCLKLIQLAYGQKK